MEYEYVLPAALRGAKTYLSIRIASAFNGHFGCLFIISRGIMIAACTSLVVALLLIYLNPTNAMNRHENVVCEAQDPPLRKSTDCFHAIDLMTHTLHALVPAAFRYGECLVLLQALYNHPPPPRPEFGLPLPEGMMFLRAQPLRLADRLDTFDYPLQADARVTATNILRDCLRAERPMLGWGLEQHWPSRDTFYFVALKTVPADMPSNARRWEFKPPPGQLSRPWDAPYTVYNAPQRSSPSGVPAIDREPSTSSGSRDGDSEPSKSGPS